MTTNGVAPVDGAGRGPGGADRGRHRTAERRSGRRRRCAVQSSRGSVPRLSATAPTPVADVRLELLKSVQRSSGPSTRNPFQFKPKAPAPAPPRPGGVGRGMRRSIVVGPPAPPAGPPPPPPIVLKYIGEFETAQGKVAVFRDTGGDIINGKEGDIIDGRYRLLKIGVESADLAYLDGRGRETIRLSGR